MPVYLDHNATTPLDPRVLEAMMPYLTTHFGNPSSVHRYGRLARNAIDESRARVAALVGVHFSQVVFTGGGTEANNLALRGTAARLPRGRVLVSAVEHSSVLEPAERLRELGFEVERIPVDADCRVDLAALDALLAGGDVRLVSVMLANNETGAIQDIPRIAERVRRAGAILHTDAIQAAGKLAIDFASLGVHLLTLSAHKLYGPKGVGALIFDRALDIAPLIAGGGHEHGLRAGTENLAGIVGFGAAAEFARAELAQRAAHARALRDRLEAALAGRPGIVLFARSAERVPNTLQLGVVGIDGETVQMGLDRKGFAVSTGSACHSGTGKPSHVLLAMGVNETLARGAIRVSIGKDNTAAEIDRFVEALASVTGALPARAVEVSDVH
ncbi:MAG TPA: cysteine desulfurase family protein [Gammaproteobacteria bacterium]|nr:cysteine desulfurase family protein [Gammaproteobacteria bacterium]